MNEKITRLRYLFNSIIHRCYDKNHPSYMNYGGRGITVCDEWMDNIQTFYSWANINGYEIGLTIDRINNNLGYSPQNCRFISRKENTRNTRRSKWWVINGIRYPSATEAAKAEGVSARTIKDWCDGYSQPSQKGQSYYPPKEGCSSELKYPEQMELNLWG